jgi:hypothetical protein
MDYMLFDCNLHYLSERGFFAGGKFLPESSGASLASPASPALPALPASSGASSGASPALSASSASQQIRNSVFFNRTTFDSFRQKGQRTKERFAPVGGNLDEQLQQSECPQPVKAAHIGR